MTFDEQLGKQVRRCRTMRGYTQRELAKIMEITAQQLQKYESGKNRISVFRLYQMAQALGVPMLLLLKCEENIIDGPLADMDGPEGLPFSLLRSYHRIEDRSRRRLLCALAAALAEPGGPVKAD